MMKQNDIWRLAPLSLLIFLLWTSKVGHIISGAASHPEIAAFRYFAIPLIGLSIGFTAFLWTSRKDNRLDPSRSFFGRRILFISFLLCVLFSLLFFGLSSLRYLSLNTSSGELGWYESKIWNISRAPSLFEALKTASTGYFQPLLILHGLLYRITDSPVFLQLLQTAAVVSGAAPLYLIARGKLKDANWAAAVVILYLLYPAVEYNAAMEFHPDHLAIPFFMWAFYLAEKERYWAAVLLAGLGGLAKEQLILSSAFFGLYIYLEKGRRPAGLIAFVSYMALFLAAVLYIQPYLTSYYAKLGNVAHGSNFEYLLPSSAQSLTGYIGTVAKGALIWKSKKALFLIFIFLPFLFIPLISVMKFVPALPSFAIPLLSSYPYHSSVDMQYTASIVPSVFVALVFAMSWVRERFGERYLKSLFVWLFVMSVTVNIAHSPSPLSPNFWVKGWSPVWYKDLYMKGGRFEDLAGTLSMVPEDPSAKVVSQYNINSSRLSHRTDYWIFPERWREGDYILLDRGNPYIPVDVKYMPKEIYATEKFFSAEQLQLEKYTSTVSDILSSGLFSVRSERNGIVLFERKKGTWISR